MCSDFEACSAGESKQAADCLLMKSETHQRLSIDNFLSSSDIGGALPSRRLDYQFESIWLIKKQSLDRPQPRLALETRARHLAFDLDSSNFHDINQSTLEALNLEPYTSSAFSSIRSHSLVCSLTRRVTK